MHVHDICGAPLTTHQVLLTLAVGGSSRKLRKCSNKYESNIRPAGTIGTNQGGEAPSCVETLRGPLIPGQLPELP